MLAGCEVVVEGLTNFSCGPFKWRFFIVVGVECGGGRSDETTDGSTT